MQAREEAAQEFFVKEMNFHDGQIKVKETKLSNSNKWPLMWVKIGELNAQLLFCRAAQILKGKAQKFPIIDKIPTEFWQRFRSIEKNCWTATQRTGP